MKTKRWIIETISINKTVITTKHFEQKLCELWDTLLNKIGLPKTELFSVKSFEIPISKPSRPNKKGDYT